MEQITIPKAEYEKLKSLAMKIELIEEVIHEPELSVETKKELAEARATSQEEYVDDERIIKEFS
tara:strand:+ start:271 stop:462 length:192 start_codon:yes stop_codon:yes gene_type:complete